MEQESSTCCQCIAPTFWSALKAQRQHGSHGSQRRHAGQPCPLAPLPKAHDAGSLRCADRILKHAPRRMHGSQLREAGHRPRGTGRLCRSGRLCLASATDCLQSTPCVLAYPSSRPHNTAKRASHQTSRWVALTERVPCARGPHKTWAASELRSKHACMSHAPRASSLSSAHT